jgi:hypothetical protein
MKIIVGRPKHAAEKILILILQFATEGKKMRLTGEDKKLAQGHTASWQQS